MIVRESPKSGVRREPQNWPPKSPHEALLSSPSGRRKYERERQRNSVSPSPVKRRPASRGQPEDDEDEEELELQLQAIQARLKLKQLRRERARQAAEDDDNDSTRAVSRPNTAAGLRRVELPRPHSAIQVPVSPTRNRRAPDEQKSPARVLLGIDKGLRAQDVSLKRAASFHSRSNAMSGTLSRSNSAKAAETPRAKSFSERIAESREKDREREEKQSRIEKSRSRGFGLNNPDSSREGASSRAGSVLSSGARSGQGMAPPARKGSDLLKSRSSNDLRTPSTPRPPSNLSTRSEASRAPSTSTTTSRTSSSTLRTTTTSKFSTDSSSFNDDSRDVSVFESFSGLHLKSREMQHNTLTRMLDGKTIFTIPQLLKSVKSPEYEPPDMENDYVVIGIICSKSSPLTPKNARREQSTNNPEANANQSGKFMVIRLTDLKWELDLFLFDTGFSQFWKLPIGTLVAVLNPEIMPPRNRDTGKFSLKLASSDDTVLEIGTARDLDFCHAIRKDGKECGQWIDGRKTEFCDFHIELQVEKSKRGRMEVNTMTGFGKGPGGSGGRFGMFGGGGKGGGLKEDSLRREGKFHDRSLHETVYIAPGAGGAARLLDEDDSWERGASRAELHRKRLAEKEKERELAKKLGEIGSGVGSDYMKVKGVDTSSLPAKYDAHLTDSGGTTEKSALYDDPLGLVGKRADDVSLAPVKRKRMLSGKSTASSEPVGWGGAFKRGLLLSPKKDTPSSAREARETSPMKKKARLLLPEKGIREPGRDSIGGLDVGLLAAMDEDDDDLEVI
ncbi:uncharacterized protein BDR25DRAFT_346527 [Lindgomyces ingoldianus]|uniref:Uncharacterized protein n=1 Tax=Lindgomyces ingoldianus TaxID=673940 RepID=A0ACB6QCL1_9PLEO|nr:uncharacterized protein BDR25DRAFT_346527 [Lindgomyces ingoldianus]KAF2464719.1 hypothetical protein BDR25DRAFT_346527 [Lindgomyces ingoldianus]